MSIKIGRIELPKGDPNCEECDGEGWVAPIDLPNEHLFAVMELEPCCECGDVPHGKGNRDSAWAWFAKRSGDLARELARIGVL